MIIQKKANAKIKSNLLDYPHTYASFDWEEIRNWKEAEEWQLKGLPNGGINIAYEALNAHFQGNSAQEVSADKLALRWISKHDQIKDFSYGDLAEQSSRFASVLDTLAVKSQARVYSLLGRVPELYIAALGTLKAGCVFTPLFSAFGPEPIRSRMEIGEANVLITTTNLYRKKIAGWHRELPHLGVLGF